MKFLKDLFTLHDGEGWCDFALIVMLWLVIGVGGFFTISTIGRYLMAINPVLGEIFGGSILAIGLIELYCYWISVFIEDGKRHYNKENKEHYNC